MPMQNSEIIFLGLLLIGAMVLLIAYAFRLNAKRQKQNAQFTIYRKPKKEKDFSSSKVLIPAYHFFSRFFLTRRFVRKVRKQYEIIVPEDLRTIELYTMQTVFLVFGVDLLCFLVMFLVGPTFNMIMSTILLVYVLSSEIVLRKTAKLEEQLVIQLEHYLGDVRHEFFQHGMIDEAIFNTLGKAPKLLQNHAEVIYKILISDDMEEGVEKYNDTVPNRFLKTFLALCVTVMQYGDKVVDDRSLFLTNLKNLRQELMIEMIRIRNMRSKFSGLIMVAVAPSLCLRLAESWGVSVLPELLPFYQGISGRAVAVVTVGLSILGYTMISYLRDVSYATVPEHPFLTRVADMKWVQGLLAGYMDRNYGKMLLLQERLNRIGETLTSLQFVVQRCLFVIGIFIFGMFYMMFTIVSYKNFVISDVDSIETVTSGATDEQVVIIKESVIIYTDKYLNSNANEDTILADVESGTELNNPQLESTVVDLVLERIQEYHDTKFEWYMLLGVMVVAFLSNFIPIGLLKYKEYVLGMHMEDEVIQFQSIILMLAYIDRMTIDNILWWMQIFAVIFRDSIQKCIDNLSSGDMDALAKLKDDEPFPQFVRLIENLEASDKVGVAQAFSELAVERNNYQEKRKLDNEIRLKTKYTMGLFIAYTPIAVFLAFYLIGPFVTTSFGIFDNYMEEMQTELNTEF